MDDSSIFSAKNNFIYSIRVSRPSFWILRGSIGFFVGCVGDFFLYLLLVLEATRFLRLELMRYYRSVILFCLFGVALFIYFIINHRLISLIFTEQPFHNLPPFSQWIALWNLLPIIKKNHETKIYLMLKPPIFSAHKISIILLNGNQVNSVWTASNEGGEGESCEINLFCGWWWNVSERYKVKVWFKLALLSPINNLYQAFNLSEYVL